MFMGRARCRIVGMLILRELVCSFFVVIEVVLWDGGEILVWFVCFLLG